MTALAAEAAPVTWIAGELILEGLCSARCLLALGEGPCDCPCEGRWHGALTGVDAGEGISPEQRARMREQARAEARAAARAQVIADATAVRRKATAASGVPRRRGRPPLPHGDREYPGAPVGDRRAFQQRRGPEGTSYAVAVGRNLGEHAQALVLAALASVPEGSSLRVVCAEANRIKASRPDLDDCRYLSREACRRVLAELAAAGEIPGGSCVLAALR